MIKLTKVLSLLFLLLGLSTPSLRAQEHVHSSFFEAEGRYREHSLDMISLDLTVDLDPKDRRVNGLASYQCIPIQKGVDSAFFDAVDISMDYILLDNDTLNYAYAEGGVVIYFPNALDWNKTYRLTFSYTCQPAKGIYFVGWDDPTGRARKQIWTQGQGINHRHWIPSFDDQNDKLITSVHVAFPSAYTVIGNGVLQSKQEQGKNTLWHYAMNQPHALYLLMLAIGDYDMLSMESNSHVQHEQYYYPDKPEAAEVTYRFSREMMDWFEAELGIDYPWPKVYRNVPVRDFLYGAMENTTSTIFTDIYLQDDREALERNYIGTNAHELAHQWFGDYITAWSGRHHWLHESFATHYAKHFRREVLGETIYDEIRWGERRTSMRAAERDNFPVGSIAGGSARHYDKGSLVLDMMRFVLGDEAYTRSIKHYLKKHPYGMVDSHHLYIAIMECTGVNLDWFFEEWVYGGGEPHYSIRRDSVAGGFQFVIRQIHDTSAIIGPFTMPMDFKLVYSDGQYTQERHKVEGLTDTIFMRLEDSYVHSDVSFSLVDVNREVLSQRTWERSSDELLAQAYRAENFMDRMDALEGLDYIHFSDEKALYGLYASAQTRLEKRFIISRFRHLSSGHSLWMRDALTDEDHMVRRQALWALDTIPLDYQEEVLLMLSDSSYVNIALALDALCKSFPQEQSRFIDEVAEVKNATVRIYALKQSIANDKKAVQELTDMCGPSYEFRTRISALNAIRDLEDLPNGAIRYAMDAAVHFNSRLARQGQSTLEKHWSDALKRQCERYLKKMNLVPWQINKWEKFSDRMDAKVEE